MQADAQQMPAAEDKPEFLPDKFWREGKADYEALAKSYTGLEQLLGKKANAVMVPNEKSTPEEIAAFRKAIGVPEKPDDYIPALKPEQLPEGVTFDENLAKAASSIAHKHNIPPAAMRELANLQMQQVQGMYQAINSMALQELETARTELKQVYGDKLNEKLDLAKRVAVSAGVPIDSKGFSDSNMVRFALWAAEKISEDKLVTAQSPILSSPAQQAKDIMRNPENPLHRRYLDHDPEIVDRVRRMLSQN